MKQKTVNQGYTIIERFTVGEQGFALGENLKAPSPYVTWQYQAADTNHFYWGHYFTEKLQAYNDYSQRIDQEIEYVERLTKEPFYLPPLCLAIEPSSGNLINIKRCICGYFLSDRNIPGEREYNLETAEHANKRLGVTKAQATAMVAGSMFGWNCPAADPKSYDENSKMIPPRRRDDHVR